MAAKGNYKNIPKRSFKLKRNDTGSILTIHNTFTTENGEIKRRRFYNGCFTDSTSLFVAIDCHGTIFVLDLKGQRYWELNVLVPQCSVVHFYPNSVNEIIFGTKNGLIILMDLDDEHIERKIQPFQIQIKSISFPNSVGLSLFLCTTVEEAVIYNRNTFEQKHKLHPSEIMLRINKMAFIPTTDQLYGTFDDNTIHIWSNDASFKQLKLIEPIREKEKYVRKIVPDRLNIATVADDSDDDRCNAHLGNDDNGAGCKSTDILGHIIKDYRMGLIADVCFSNCGTDMYVTTIDHHLIMYKTFNWTIYNIIHTPDVTIRQFEFIPQFQSIDDNKRLTAITSVTDVVLFDLNCLRSPLMIYKGLGHKLHVSRNGCLLAILLKSGEVTFYDINHLVEKLKGGQRKIAMITEKEDVKVQLENFNDEIQKIIPRKSLLDILKTYHEFPEKYRILIWKSLLSLPDNSNAFGRLIAKGLHPTVDDYDNRFPLDDPKLHRNLKRIVSALTHWCRIYGECNFIPNIVYPFLKVFDDNVLMCFETVATILLNHGQLWFEFAPIEPINYLGMIENLLAFYEPGLIDFYDGKKVRSTVYGWSLIQTAFTEVLDQSQWFQLWDNIISNPPWFLIFSVVAFNSMLKSTIMRLKNSKEIERFFDEQTNIDMKQFIRRCYEFIEKCPKQLHPNQFMKSFEPLCSGDYQKFLNYPQKLANLKIDKMNQLKIENDDLNKKLFDLEKRELSLAARLENEIKRTEHANRMKEVEKRYEDELNAEAERVAYQRKQLLYHQRLLNQKESETLEAISNHHLNLHGQTQEREFQQLNHLKGREIIDRESRIQLAENELKNKEMKLLLEQYNLKLMSQLNKDSELKAKKRLRSESDKLDTQLNKIISDQSKAGSSLTIKAVECMIERVKKEFNETCKRKC